MGQQPLKYNQPALTRGHAVNPRSGYLVVHHSVDDLQRRFVPYEWLTQQHTTAKGSGTKWNGKHMFV